MEMMNTDLQSSSSTSNSFRSSGNTKPAGVLKLFGVRLTRENSMVMRKAASMGNLSCYNSTTSQPPHPSTPEHSESGGPHGYVSDGLLQNAGGLRERKKGVPWTEDEHRMFLVGLQKLGKGDWRGISRNFVPSRTPTQVASHAQKYFLRQSNLNKRKRRSSLFDIVSSNTVPSDNTTIPATMELNSTSSNLSFNLTAPFGPLEPPRTYPVNITSLSSDRANVSADLCLGCTHKSPPPPPLLRQQNWPHTFSLPQQADVASVQASASTSDCMQLLPPLSFMPHHMTPEREMVRPSISMASSPPQKATTSPTMSKLCRIDEANDLSANLRLSIGPSTILLEPMELSLKLEQPVPTRHSTAMAGTNTNSNTLTNAIRVV